MSFTFCLISLEQDESVWKCLYLIERSNPEDVSESRLNEISSVAIISISR